MRKIIVTEFVSLDGVMEHPAWSAPYWNDQIASFKAEDQLATGALLLGRVTYQGFAAAWPGRTDDGAEYMNSVPKHVVSNTLTHLEWNNSRLMAGDAVEGITRLKQDDGPDLLVYGSAALVQTLIQHDLADTYRLLIYPVVLGKGKRLFQDGTTATLRLVKSDVFSTGVNALVYEPVRS